MPGPDSDSEDDDHDAAALLDVVRTLALCLVAVLLDLLEYPETARIQVVDGTATVHVRQVRDPVSSDRCYIIHGHGAIGISLPWLPVLGGFLAHAANDNQVAPPSLPSTIALDLAGEWGKDGIIGARTEVLPPLLVPWNRVECDVQHFLSSIEILSYSPVC